MQFRFRFLNEKKYEFKYLLLVIKRLSDFYKEYN